MLSGLDADCRIGRVLPSKSSQAVTSVLSTRFGSYSLQVPQWSGQRLLRGLNLLLCLYLNIELPFYLSGRKKCTITTVVQLLICPQAIILVKCLILVLLHTCLICSVTAAVHLCIPPKTCLSCSARPTWRCLLLPAPVLSARTSWILLPANQTNLECPDCAVSVWNPAGIPDQF